MNEQRLRHLITVLERVAEKRLPFDMNHWVRPNDEPSCGTAACALGWAAMDPEFRKQGLMIRTPRGHRLTAPRSLRWWRDKIPTDFVVQYDVFTGTWAAARFFDIELSWSYHLFVPNRYGSDIRPQDVIRRVREMMGQVRAD